MNFVVCFWLGLAVSSVALVTQPAAAQRVPWTDSRIHGSPEPPSPYQIRRVFPKLQFKDLVEMCSAPGTDRLFVAEQAGRIYSFRRSAEVTKPDLFLDLTQTVPGGVNALYGLEFHPGFVTNRFVYVCYVVKDGAPDGTRVSRFTVAKTDPPEVDASSEHIILTWLAGGHNGGSIKFGPDGKLFISTGDGGVPNPPDPLRTGQDLSDLLSSILRIDVDSTDGAQPYRVPADNPFTNRPGVRPEIWAYGLRNPWRMSFDRQEGTLWTADVGWELWEMVYQIERGGNYGWSIVEGPQSIHPDWKRGPTPILPPLKAHPHTEAASITGGSVYRGHRLKELVGAYIYGDWVTGKIWALRSHQGQPTSVTELVDTPLQVVCFGEDRAGELFVVDYHGGIYELEANTNTSAGQDFPRLLSQTGLYASVDRAEPAPGVRPFAINAEMWADGATAQRWIALPDRTSIQTGEKDGWLNQVKNDWHYPSNAVLAKTFSLEMERGKPETARRIETQVLHFDGQDWHAYTYQWNEAQTDGKLVEAAGETVPFEIRDATAPDGHRQQLWRFHSRSECLRCHNPWANNALAFTAPQLNREMPPALSVRPGVPGPHARNQLRQLAQADYFDQPLDERASPTFANPYDASVGLNKRARSWLQVNCAHCHREGAGGSVVSHFDHESSVPAMKAIGQLPSQGTLGLQGAQIISAGDPYSSVLYFRTSTLGEGRMPLIGSTQVDTRGVQLLHDWIQEMPQNQGSATVEANAQGSALLGQMGLANAGSIPSISKETADRLLATPNGALALLSALNRRPDHFCPPDLAEKVAQHPNAAIRGLFERFLPDRLRPKKLGLSFKPDQVLSLSGNAERGRSVFFRDGVACSQCHRISGQGRDFGPDLSQIGRKYPRDQILEQIIAPSQKIEPAFVSYQLETQDDHSYSGLILKRTADEVWLREATENEVHLPLAQIKSLRPQQLSAMPEGLLQSMTAQDAADLIEFLASRQ